MSYNVIQCNTIVIKMESCDIREDREALNVLTCSGPAYAVVAGSTIPHYCIMSQVFFDKSIFQAMPTQNFLLRLSMLPEPLKNGERGCGFGCRECCRCCQYPSFHHPQSSSSVSSSSRSSPPPSSTSSTSSWSSACSLCFVR